MAYSFFVSSMETQGQLLGPDDVCFVCLVTYMYHKTNEIN